MSFETMCPAAQNDLLFERVVWKVVKLLLFGDAVNVSAFRPQSPPFVAENRNSRPSNDC